MTRASGGFKKYAPTKRWWGREGGHMEKCRLLKVLPKSKQIFQIPLASCTLNKDKIFQALMPFAFRYICCIKCTRNAAFVLSVDKIHVFQQMLTSR